DHPFVAGVLTQEVMVRDERLELGVVAHAEYIREAIAEMDAAEAVGP
ncbi:MAG: serine protease, partial [Brevundimonas sp.]